MSFSLVPVNVYDASFVKTSLVKHNNVWYTTLYMNRQGSGNRIKVKYFSAKDSQSGKSVAQRYREWSAGRNVICYSSGAYMVDGYDGYTPEGFNVDNGVLVNSVLQNQKFDGLVIVYATGGMVATNLKDGDLTLDTYPNRKFDIRNRSLDKSAFQNWCQDNGATVFQTHLLVYKDQIKISPSKSSPNQAKRRFLAVGKENGQIHHAIVQFPGATTLYEGTSMVYDFLKNNKGMEIIYMINLDTGMQDVCQLYKPDGAVDTRLVGEESLDEAVNLLVYYFD